MKIRVFKQLQVFMALVLFILFALPHVQLAGRPNSFASINTTGQLPQADDFGIVTPTISGIGPSWHLNLRIEQPPVKQHIKKYYGVNFEPGDRVTISAGGCVQTGGAGKTWKRYVDPEGPNSDRLYHGLIWIPGVTGGLPILKAPQPAKRLQEVINKVFILGLDVALPRGTDLRREWSSDLTLGYEDDNYSDNGYSDHDDGTGDQCKGVGNAFVNITIDRRLPAGVIWHNGKLTMLSGRLAVNKAGQVYIQHGNDELSGPEVFTCLGQSYAMPREPGTGAWQFCHLMLDHTELICRRTGEVTGPACPTCFWAPTNLPRP